VHSLEYQSLLVKKFSQMLLSFFMSDPPKVSGLLREYQLDEIVYDLFVTYVIKDCQISNEILMHQNISNNDIWTLITSVLIPAMNSQNAVDNLVIRILDEFILRSKSSCYSQPRIIECVEALPYSYDKVMCYALDNLDKAGFDNSAGIEQTFANLVRLRASSDTTIDNANRFLITVLALNNLGGSKNKSSQEANRKSLRTLLSITDWVVNSSSTPLQCKRLLLKMLLEQLIFLLEISPADFRAFVSSERFLTQLILTVFALDSPAHGQYIRRIFDLLLAPDSGASADQTGRSEAIESSCRFWQHIVRLFIEDEHVLGFFCENYSWVEHLIFSLELYLKSLERLSLGSAVSRTQSLVATSSDDCKFTLDFDVVTRLIGLLTRLSRQDGGACGSQNKTAFGQDVSRVCLTSHLTKLWSLAIEALA